MIKNLSMLTILLLSSSAVAKTKKQWMPIFNDGLVILVPYKYDNTQIRTYPVKIKKTGQKISYDEIGNVITNHSVKDDGYYQKGVTPSYNRSLGVVTDYITELQWSDTKNVGLEGWNEANTYCHTLQLAGTGWRLPTVKELDSIVLPSIYNPTIDTTVFQNYFSGTFGDYWTSSVGAGTTDKMWRLHLWSGGMRPTYTNLDGVNRCVRSNKSSRPASFTRVGDVVKDNNTGLEWEDTEVVYEGKWLEAIHYCENLKLNKGGWRLPNINELKSIIDYSRWKPSIHPIFKNAVVDQYWSSTTSPIYTDYANLINFWRGGREHADKNYYDYSTRCVR